MGVEPPKLLAAIPTLELLRFVLAVAALTCILHAVTVDLSA